MLQREHILCELPSARVRNCCKLLVVDRWFVTIIFPLCVNNILVITAFARMSQSVF